MLFYHCFAILVTLFCGVGLPTLLVVTLQNVIIGIAMVLKFAYDGINRELGKHCNFNASVPSLNWQAKLGNFIYYTVLRLSFSR